MNFLASKKSDCCCICLDLSPDIANLCCGSASHFRCLRKWAETACYAMHMDVACPMCRHPFTSKIISMTPPGPMPTPILQSSPSPLVNDRFVPTLRSPPSIVAQLDQIARRQDEVGDTSFVGRESAMRRSQRLDYVWREIKIVICKTPRTLMILLFLLYLTFASALVLTYVRESRLNSVSGTEGLNSERPIITRNNLIEAILYTLSAAMIIEMTRAVITTARDL